MKFENRHGIKGIFPVIFLGYILILSGASVAWPGDPTQNYQMVYDRNQHTAIINITIGTMDVGVWHGGNYYGPLDTMVRARNGDLLIFTRMAHSHVYVNDKGWILEYRSIDNGTTFIYTGVPLFAANPTFNIDGRNVISGITPTGRIFVIWWELNVGADKFPSNATQSLTGQMAYKYSDDNGGNWSVESGFNFGDIPDASRLHYMDSYNISCPYGQVMTYQNNRIGFSFMVINDTWGINESMSAFAYSDDNGLTWSASGMSDVGLYPFTGHSEATATYVGNGKIISVVRTDNSQPWLYISENNGKNWTDGHRKNTNYGLSPGQQGYVTLATKDDIGETWIVLFAIYDTYFVTVAPANEILQSDYGFAMTHGLESFPIPAQYYPNGVTTGWGISQTIVWNETTHSGFIVSSNGTLGAPNQISSVWVQPITITINRIASLSTAISFDGLIWLLIIFFPAICISQAMPKIGFAIGLVIMLLIFGFSLAGFMPTTIIGLMGIGILFFRGE